MSKILQDIITIELREQEFRNSHARKCPSFLKKVKPLEKSVTQHDGGPLGVSYERATGNEGDFSPISLPKDQIVMVSTPRAVEGAPYKMMSAEEAGIYFAIEIRSAANLCVKDSELLAVPEGMKEGSDE